MAEGDEHLRDPEGEGGDQQHDPGPADRQDVQAVERDREAEDAEGGGEDQARVPELDQIELWHPGLIFPATFGVLCLAIAFYGLDVLPISWAGVVLLVAAFAFWITEMFIAFSHGALTVAGGVCFVFGCLLLFEPAGSGYQVSLSVALTVAAMFSLFFMFALAKIVQIRRRPASVGPQTIVGAHGEVRPDGHVAVRGELWQAHTEDGEPLEPGEEVDVVRVEGLSLVVRRSREPAAV